MREQVLLVDHRAVEHCLEGIADDGVLDRVHIALAHGVVDVSVHPQGAE